MAELPSKYADLLKQNGFEPSLENLILFFEMTLSEQILKAAYYKRGCSQAYLAGKLSKSVPPTFGVQHEAAKESDQ